MSINSNLQKTINETFLQLLDDLKGKDEIEMFLSDFLGKNEYQDLVKKLAVIYWLRKKRPKDIIKNNLGVSLALINNVERVIDKKGIKLAIKYMEAEEFANVWAEKIKKLGTRD